MKKLSKKDVTEIIRNFSNFHITVIGDIIADEYIYGKLSRISREAPVLILKYENSNVVPGGGGNAAVNISALGGKCSLIGFLGNDDYAKKVKTKLEEYGIDTGGIILKKGNSIIKTRVLAGGSHTTKQQLLRIDKEEKIKCTGSEEKKVVQFVGKSINKTDGILFSDYGLGAITGGIRNSVIEQGNSHSVIIGVDSRYELMNYKNVTIATPNEWELKEAFSINNITQDGIIKYGNELKNNINSRNLIVTQGSSGMTLFDSENNTFQLPVIGSDEVADVTGCGDTVISTLMLSLAAGADLMNSGRIANHAGAVAVTKRGTSVVYREELINHISKFWEE